MPALQYYVFLVLSVLAFGMEVYALVDAVRRPAAAFTAAGKKTKQLWMVILGVATAIGFIALPLPVGLIGSLSLLSLVAIVASAVYLVDVRPAVRQIRGGGAGRNNGPYGPW